MSKLLHKAMTSMLLNAALTSSLLEIESSHHREERIRPDTSVRPTMLIPREKSEEERQRRREHKKKIKAKKNARRHAPRR